MKYKEFKKAIKELGLGLQVRSRFKWNEVFDIEVVNNGDDLFARIKKYKQSSFDMNTDALWMTEDVSKRSEFAKLVIEFAMTPIEEREYGPKTREPRYQVHLGDDLNLINYGDLHTLALDFANNKDTISSSLLWSEQELAMLMEEMPNLAWHECLIDVKKEMKNVEKELKNK